MVIEKKVLGDGSPGSKYRTYLACPVHASLPYMYMLPDATLGEGF